MEPKICTLSEIEAVTSSSPSFKTDLIDAVSEGFVSYSSGKFNACPIQTMGAPPMAAFACSADAVGGGGVSRYAAQTCVKSGYLTGAEHFVVKVASGGHPMPNTGCVQVCHAFLTKRQALAAFELTSSACRCSPSVRAGWTPCFSTTGSSPR